MIQTVFILSVVSLLMWGNDQVEARDGGGKRIHPRQNLRDRSLLNTLQQRSQQDSKKEIVCKEAVGGGCF